MFSTFKRFSGQTALCLSSVVLLGLLTGCRAERSVSEVETNEDASKSTVTEVAEPASDTSAAESERLYAELVEVHGQDYESCGESIRAEADICSEEGVAGEVQKENLNIQLILDASGSMAEWVGGEEKLTVAKETLTEFVGSLPERANVALRVYGHVGSNSEQDREKSCAGTELLYDFQSLDEGKFDEVIASFSPTGWTPIADSLKQAVDDFSRYDVETNENVVYLVSDGIETCDGDPVAAAQALHQSEVSTVVNVIGFDVDASSAAQLRAVAQAGGGDYIEADNRDELNRIFNQTFLSAHSKYNCTVLAQHGAHNKTLLAQHSRYNCLSVKAQREYNAISLQVSRQRNEGQISSETRKAILNMANQKREDLLEPAKEERDRILNEAKEERDAVLEPAREERDHILDEARKEKEAGQ